MTGKDLSIVGMCFLVGIALGLGILIAGDHPQDKHTTQASEWYFQEEAINNSLRGKTIKRIWASGSKLVIECDGGTNFEYTPELWTKIEMLPRGKLTRPNRDQAEDDFVPAPAGD